MRNFFGQALDFAKYGDQHNATKVLRGFGGAGILEVVDDDAGGTYRAVYTVTCKEAVFVLHGLQCSQKKLESATATPKENTEIIRVRLTVAEAIAKER